MEKRDVMGNMSYLPTYDLDLENKLNQIFAKKAYTSSIFPNIDKAISLEPEAAHFIVGYRWLQFSEKMPDLLSLMIQNTKQNIDRCRFVTILFEELGCGKAQSVHSSLYKDALKSAGITENRLSVADPSLKLNETAPIENEIRKGQDEIILGISMGLELIAQENIAVLAKAYSVSGRNDLILNSDLFFQIHFQNEIEHIESNLINYEDLETNDQKTKFKIGVNISLDFWQRFWDNTANSIIQYARKA